MHVYFQNFSCSASQLDIKMINVYSRWKRCARTWAARDAELARTNNCPDADFSVALPASGMRSWTRDSAVNIDVWDERADIVSFLCADDSIVSYELIVASAKLGFWNRCKSSLNFWMTYCARALFMYPNRRREASKRISSCSEDWMPFEMISLTRYWKEKWGVIKLV